MFVTQNTRHPVSAVFLRRVRARSRRGPEPVGRVPPDVPRDACGRKRSGTTATATARMLQESRIVRSGNFVSLAMRTDSSVLVAIITNWQHAAINHITRPRLPPVPLTRGTFFVVVNTPAPCSPFPPFHDGLFWLSILSGPGPQRRSCRMQPISFTLLCRPRRFRWCMPYAA